jgi:hypothetical protein
MLPLGFFDRYGPALSALPTLPVGERYPKSQLLSDAFHIFAASGLDVYYAPFHHLGSSARVALVGLTPGFTQMENAFRAAKEGERLGLSGARLFAHIDAAGSFSGPMRQNLVSMLDQIGLNKCLGISTCEALFAGAHAMVHFTSAVSAPIFKGERNYNGPLLKVPQLREWVIQNLAAELRALPEAIIIPLGTHAGGAVDLLTAHGAIDAQRCLTGFPHPSGANGHRKRLFELHRKRWCDQIAG